MYVGRFYLQERGIVIPTIYTIPRVRLSKQLLKEISRESVRGKASTNMGPRL